MAVTGAWGVKNAYSGAEKWGTGINPIHSIRNSGDPEELISIKEGFYNGEGGTVPDEITEDYSFATTDYSGEDPRMTDSNPVGKSYDRSQIPANYPSWEKPGIEREEDTAWRSIPHLSPMESFRYVNSTFAGQNVTGGWQSKQRGQDAYSQTSNQTQYEINTSMVQGPGVGVMVNTRAQERGLEPRSPITSRTAGMREKFYGMSFEMGGGEATPRMFPYQQSGIKRPFYYRTPGLAPEVYQQYNSIEGRQPYTYVAPDNPYTGPDATSSTGYDYSDGDYYA
jgi:hypothetical protein